MLGMTAVKAMGDKSHKKAYYGLAVINPLYLLINAFKNGFVEINFVWNKLVDEI